jgi:hypothetical protein
LSMTGGYHFYIVRREFFKAFCDYVPEWHHYLGKVALSGLVDTPFISYIEVGCAIWEPKKSQLKRILSSSR